jgi:hypothetical protein
MAMLLRRIARPLIAGIFIQGGIAALRDPAGHEHRYRENSNDACGDHALMPTTSYYLTPFFSVTNE